MANRITIRFGASGDKALIRAIKQLDIATKRLQGTTSRYEKELVVLRGSTEVATKGMLKLNHSARNTAGAFSVLRSQMLLASFAIALAIRPILQLTKLAGDAEETITKANVVFGESITVVTNWAATLSTAIGRVKTDLIGYAATLQDTLIPMGLSRDAAAELSTIIVQLSIDQASFNNKLDADAVRAFQSALVGNHETLKEYGIMINESTLKQEAYNLGISDGSKKLSEIEKMYVRVSLMIKGSEDALGDAQRTQDSYNNTLKKFGSFWKDVGIEVGNALKPIIKAMATFLSTERTVKNLVIAMTALVTQMAVARTATFLLTLSMTKLKVAITRTGVGALAIAFGIIVDHFLNANSAVEKLSGSIKDAADMNKALKEGIEELDGANKNNTMSIEDGIQALKDQAFALQFTGEGMQHLARVGYRVVSDAEGELINKIIEHKKRLEDLRRETKLQNSVLQTQGAILKDNIAFLEQRNEELLKGAPSHVLDMIESLLEIVEPGDPFELLAGNYTELIETILKNTWVIDALTKDYKHIEEMQVFRAGNIDLNKRISLFKKNMALNAKNDDMNFSALEVQVQSGSIQEKIAIVKAKIHFLDNQAITNSLTQAQITTQQNLLLVEEIKLENELHQQKINNAFELMNAVTDVGNTYIQLKQQQMDQAKQEELSAVGSIRNERIRQQKIDAISEKYARKQKELNKESKRVKRVQTVIATATGIMEALASKEMGAFARIAMATMVGVMGAMQLKMIDSQKYEHGGAVGGRRHSAGGTMIEAEQGEFVVSRSGVEAVGMETLNRINTGGGAGVGATIVINNPILGKDTIEDEIVPQIKEALRRGGSIA